MIPDNDLIRKYASMALAGFTLEQAKETGVVQDANDIEMWDMVAKDPRSFMEGDPVSDLPADILDQSALDDMFERVMAKVNAMEKAVPKKTEDGVEYPAAAFAYVPDPTMPSTWKLRLWDDLEQKESRRQIGMAVAALGVGFRGNKVQIPAEDLPGVKAKVAAAWKKVNPELTEDEMPSVIKARSFDGNRSAAGSYAARMRWRGSNRQGLGGAEAKAEIEAREKFGLKPPKTKVTNLVDREPRGRSDLKIGTKAEYTDASGKKVSGVIARRDTNSVTFMPNDINAKTITVPSSKWDSVKPVLSGEKKKKSSPN